jgi:hypothetical protein
VSRLVCTRNQWRLPRIDLFHGLMCPPPPHTHGLMCPPPTARRLTSDSPQQPLSALQRVDEIWVASEAQLAALAAQGLPADKVVAVVPEAVDTALLEPGLVQPLGLPGRRGYAFLAVGQLGPGAWWAELLAAYVQVGRCDWRCVASLLGWCYCWGGATALVSIRAAGQRCRAKQSL